MAQTLGGLEVLVPGEADRADVHRVIYDTTVIYAEDAVDWMLG